MIFSCTLRLFCFTLYFRRSTLIINTHKTSTKNECLWTGWYIVNHWTRQCVCKCGAAPERNCGENEQYAPANDRIFIFQLDSKYRCNLGKLFIYTWVSLASLSSLHRLLPLQVSLRILLSVIVLAFSLSRYTRIPDKWDKIWLLFLLLLLWSPKLGKCLIF